MCVRRMTRLVGVPSYQAPDDGISQFMDCDLWIVISDRLRLPLLPVRPYLLMVYDYLQRYQAPFDDDSESEICCARSRCGSHDGHDGVHRRVTRASLRGFLRGRSRECPCWLRNSSRMRAPARLDSDMRRVFSLDNQSRASQESRECIQGTSAYYETYGGSLRVSRDGADTRELFKRGSPTPERLEGNPQFKRCSQASS